MEIGKEMAGLALFSFIGCLSALLVFACVALIFSLPMLEAGTGYVVESVLDELNSAELLCSEQYVENAIPITIDSKVSYCILKRRAGRYNRIIGADRNYVIETE